MRVAYQIAEPAEKFVARRGADAIPCPYADQDPKGVRLDSDVIRLSARIAAPTNSGL